MKRLPGEFGFGSKDLQWFIYIFFSILQNRTNSLRVENETILYHKYLAFNRSSWLLSSLKAALFARQESQMAMGISITYTLAEGSKCFRNLSNCGHPRVLHWKLFDFVSPFPRDNMRYRQKLSASNPAHVQFSVDHFNAVQFSKPVLFKNLHSLLSVSEFCFWCCASFLFLMAVICSPSCIVTELALHRVSVECLLTKNNFLKFSRFGFSFVVFRQQLSYASSSFPSNITNVSSET